MTEQRLLDGHRSVQHSSDPQGDSLYYARCKLAEEGWCRLVGHRLAVHSHADCSRSDRMNEYAVRGEIARRRDHCRASPYEIRAG